MSNRDFVLWRNSRETEILIRSTQKRINLPNDQLYNLLQFLGPLAEGVMTEERGARAL